MASIVGIIITVSYAAFEDSAIKHDIPGYDIIVFSVILMMPVGLAYLILNEIFYYKTGEINATPRMD